MCSPDLPPLQIMKASLLADEDDLDLILDHHPGKQPVKTDSSQEICSPRLPISKSHGQKRYSGTVRNHILSEERGFGSDTNKVLSLAEHRAELWWVSSGQQPVAHPAILFLRLFNRMGEKMG